MRPDDPFARGPGGVGRWMIAQVIEAAHDAGRLIERVRRSGLDVERKGARRELVTRADREADRLLRDRLTALFPAAWLSEETADSPARRTARTVWVVDPLDGTKEFVEGVPEYAVAIALVESREPILAVVHNPASGHTGWAVRGQGTVWGGTPARVREGSQLLASRSEVMAGEFAAFAPEWDVRPTGSIQWKLALVAAGEGALTLSRGPKHEWDVCAGALLVREAGGVATDARGAPIEYNQTPPTTFGIVAGAPEAHRRGLTRVREIGLSPRMQELAGPVEDSSA